MPTKRDLLLAQVLSLDEQKDNLFDSFDLLAEKTASSKVPTKSRLIDVMISKLGERQQLDHFQSFLLQLARLRLQGQNEIFIDFVLNHYFSGKQRASQST